MSSRATTRRSLVVCLLVLVGLFSYEISFLVPDAHAIPAFARKYGLPCNVCHVPGFPKLNDFGNTFRDQGYQFGADVDLPTHPNITMGFWPLSMRTTVGYQAASVRTDGSGVSTGGFGFTGLDILSFGLLHRDISFGLVYTPGLGSAGFGTGPSDGDLEAAYVRLNRLERFLGVKDEPGKYLMNLKVGKFELDVPFSEKRSPTLNTPFVMYHYVAGTPYFAGITGTATSTYKNPNAFAIGENSPGVEMAGITKTAVTDGFFRYSLAGLSTNTDQFLGGSSNCSAANGCGTGGRNVNFYGRYDAVVRGLWHCHRTPDRVVRRVRRCSDCGECHLSRVPGRCRERSAILSNWGRCEFHLRWTMESIWRVRAWERQQESLCIARNCKRPECLMERRRLSS